MSCQHTYLQFSTSENAATAGYKRPTPHQRATAATTSMSKSLADPEDLQYTFPASLVLPGDDLSEDPKYPPQSLRSWLRDKDRNAVTLERNVVYVAAPPLTDVRDGADFAQAWCQLSGGDTTRASHPKLDGVIRYLTAFYHGIPVKALPGPPLRFVKWDEELPRKRTKKPIQHVGLTAGSEVVPIRARRTPSHVDQAYTHQLHLDDILDAAIELLPSDAYALIMIVQHDLYESDEDDFCCGRAYGGSRVSVVSSARYNPCLDVAIGLDRHHAWPASHCSSFIQECCSDSQDRRPRKKAKVAPEAAKPAPNAAASPIRSAVRLMPVVPNDPSKSYLTALWLSRVCLTASHELGHCFGMDHCVYYACAMQGTTSLLEDARQPPYLCPVDLAKISRAVRAIKSDVTDDQWIQERYNALLGVCESLAGDGGGMWAAYAAWLKSVIL
jgi:archaemetzincin